MNSYKTSTGDRVTKKMIDRLVHAAKKEKILQQIAYYGYNFCQECQRNDDLPIDCAHIISVDECQKSGRSELAWDTKNIRILGRRCHNKWDRNGILNPKIK